MVSDIYKIIDDLEKTPVIEELKDIKEKMKNDKEIIDLINKFNNAKELFEKYNVKEDFIKAKKELFSNDVIKRYLDIQNEINMLSLYINEKLNLRGNNESNKW